MAISKQDTIQLIQAADLDPEQEEIKTFLADRDFSEAGSYHDSLGFDLLNLFEAHNRAVWVDWKARYDEVSEKFNGVLAHFGTALKFSQEEIEESEEDYSTAQQAIDFVNENCADANVIAIRFDTEQDSVACFFFNKQKFAQVQNLELLELIDIDPSKYWEDDW